MPFYELTKPEREKLVKVIKDEINNELTDTDASKTISYFEDEDTYIRKTAYLSVGKIFLENKYLQEKIIARLGELFLHKDYKVRQTVINAAGEIGKKKFEAVQHLFDKGLFDTHHSTRNAVIGSIKKMGEVNPRPVLEWAKNYLLHENMEIRREICHGIELRGRKYPQDILPLLKELEHDKTARVRNTLIHVLGQISYKKGCLQIVVEHLKSWENRALVEEAFEEIIDVHYRYRNFSAQTQDEARKYVSENYYYSANF
jgi:hypothetical protein